MTVTPGIHSGCSTRSYGELRSRAARLAGALHALGVRTGDRVAIVLRNEPAFLEATMAAGLIGGVPVPVNWHSCGDELGYVLAHSESKVVFVHSDLLDEVESVLPDGAGVIEVSVPTEIQETYRLATDVVAASGRHLLLEQAIGEHEAWGEPTPVPPMGLIYTSGTTGKPKGILRSAISPEEAPTLVSSVLDVFGLQAGMRTLVPAPLYHTAPNVHATFALALGLDLTVMPRFDADELLAVIEAQAINHVQMVPTMFVRLLALPEATRRRYDLSSLQAVVHAAAPCPVHVKREMIAWLGPIVLEYYGGSESGPIVACDSGEWLAHPGTVGRPLDGADARVYDPEGKLRATGEVGDIYVKPPPYWPTFTYLRDDAKRQSIERGGYITIGDVGYLDEDGYLFLTDRASDVVISGGANIYPAEIESVLLALPGVRDVAVFGIPDDEYGEALATHVDAAPDAGLTEDRIREHVRGELAGYKVPKVVVFDDELPRDPAGKLFKRRLRDRYWAAAGRKI